MNKAITATIVCMGLYTCVFSQYRHKYGEITPWEINMKQCSFDQQASAVMLVSEAFCDHDEDYHLVTLNHKRIKILSEKGIENGDVTISFQSKNDYEYIDNIEAMTINIDENGNRKEFPVELKSMYTKKTSQYFSQVKFAFPEVRTGSILEYRYRSVRKYCSSLEDWYFQSSLPVCYSSFEVRPAPTLEFSYQVQKNVKYPIVIKPSGFTNTTYFEMDSLPGIDAEPYMDTREDYIQKVNFTVTKFQGVAGTRRYMSDWNEVALDLSQESGFGPEIRANIREPREMIATATAGKGDMEKMKFILDFVRKNTEWNHVYSRTAVDGLKTTWNKKTGTSGSINLLLVNLLKNAGLEVYPLLVSDRSNGKINTGTPFVNQFNNVYALVIVNGKNYYLDATDKFTPVTTYSH